MIEIKKLSKRHSKLIVYDGFSLKIEHGSITTIVGPSGYGKSTLLDLISSTIKPDSGAVIFSRQYKLSYLLQENVMLPWRTIIENITLALEIKKEFNPYKKKEVESYMKRFGLSGFENYYPDTLSGGMKQRAALIRCLITDPDLILLDEPFSNLDFDIKLKNQVELLKYQKKNGATIIMVTHDLEDAIALSDVVIVIAGRPASVKKEIVINLGLKEKDPVLARKSTAFPELFARIWDELKYIEN